MKDGTEKETKTVNEAQEEVEFVVTSNGKYQIKGKGKNGRVTLSNEIEITSIIALNGSVTLESISAGKATIKVSANAPQSTVEKIELYEYNNGEAKTSATKIKEEVVNETEVEKTYTVDLEFYKEKNYFAKLNNEKDTEEIQGVMNEDSIYTEQDLKNLATEVNTNSNTFAGETINLLDNITLTNAFTPIGYMTAADSWTGPRFSGTFNGNNNYIQLNGISEPSDLVMGIGLFGIVIDGNVQNLETRGTIATSKQRVGGICANILKDASGNASIIGCTNSVTVTGGIVGIAVIGTLDINTCCNMGKVTQNGNSNSAGGIIGTCNGGMLNVNNCYNTNTIHAYVNAGGIVGVVSNYNNIDSIATLIGCYNIGRVMVDSGVSGGILGRLANPQGNKYKSEIQILHCIWSDKNKAGTALPTAIYGAAYDTSKVRKDTASARYALSNFTNSNFNSTGNNLATF